MGETLLEYIIWLIFSILTTIVTSVLLPQLSRWISSKTQNECIQSVITDLTTTVQTTVNQLEQTVVADLKKHDTWDLSTQKDVLETAVETVMSDLMNSTKATLEKNEVDIRDTVVRYIESYIQSQK